MNREPAADELVLMRRGLEQACRLAMAASPDALERCRPLLEDIRTELERLRIKPPRDSQFGARLEGLRRDLARFGTLIDSAASFYEGWTRLRACLAGGYGPQGEPARQEAPGRISVEG